MEAMADFERVESAVFDLLIACAEGSYDGAQKSLSEWTEATTKKASLLPAIVPPEALMLAVKGFHTKVVGLLIEYPYAAKISIDVDGGQHSYPNPDPNPNPNPNRVQLKSPWMSVASRP